VTLTFTAASTVVGPYKLLTPLTLRGISLKMQLDNRLITNPQQVSAHIREGQDHALIFFFFFSPLYELLNPVQIIS
jgi:hypothetical protein